MDHPILISRSREISPGHHVVGSPVSPDYVLISFAYPRLDSAERGTLVLSPGILLVVLSGVVVVLLYTVTPSRAPEPLTQSKLNSRVWTDCQPTPASAHSTDTPVPSYLIYP